MDIDQLFRNIKVLASREGGEASVQFRQEAVALLQSALPHFPADSRIRNKLAHIYMQDKQYEAAEKLLPESDPLWSVHRVRLDLYCVWLENNASLELAQKCDGAVLKLIMAPASLSQSEKRGNYAKIRRAIGLYIRLGRYADSIRLLQILSNIQPEFKAAISYLTAQLQFIAQPNLINSPQFPVIPLAEKDADVYARGILIDIRTMQKGIDGTPEGERYYLLALAHFIMGDSKKAVEALKPIFQRNIFDPFPPIICMACSESNSDLHLHIRLALGAAAYRDSHDIAKKLIQYRNVLAEQEYQIVTSSVLHDPLYTISSGVNKAALRDGGLHKK